MTKWDEIGIIFVIKIIDFDISLSFQRFPEGYRDDQSEFLELKGEVVFSSTKNYPKGTYVPIYAFTKFEHPNPSDPSVFEFKYSERQRIYEDAPLAGAFDGKYAHISVNDRFLQALCFIKQLNKNVYLSFNCVRKKYQKPCIKSYTLSTEFNLEDYE